MVFIDKLINEWRFFLDWLGNRADNNYTRKKCPNCESLYTLLNDERAERARLINKLTDNTVKSEAKPVNDDKEWDELRKITPSKSRAQLTRDSFRKSQEEYNQLQQNKDELLVND